MDTRTGHVFAFENDAEREALEKKLGAKLDALTSEEAAEQLRKTPSERIDWAKARALRDEMAATYTSPRSSKKRR